MPNQNPDEKLEDLLCAYSEALEAGAGAAAAVEAAVPPELRERFQRAKQYLSVYFPDESSPPTVPGQIRHYRIKREIGAGTFGTVFLAQDTNLNRPVALKILHMSSWGLDPGAMQRFELEKETPARLRQLNIIKVFDAGVDNGVPFIVSEYCPGGTDLKQWLDHRRKQLLGAPRPDQPGPVNPKEAARLIITLTGAVFYFNNRGIFHRDLKPANVLLTSSNSALLTSSNSAPGGADDADHDKANNAVLHEELEKLIPQLTDFGLVKVLGRGDQLTTQGERVGTAEYMAPEQFQGQPVTSATDVYALGVILYELITGKVPFTRETLTSETFEQFGRKVIEVEPIKPSRVVARVPRDLEAICLKCLKKDPSQRYQTAQDLAKDLDCYLGHWPTTARPVGDLERLVKWGRRSPPRAIAAVLAVIFTVGVIGWGMREWKMANEHAKAVDGENKALEGRRMALEGEKVATQRALEEEAKRARVEEEKARVEAEKAQDAEKALTRELVRAGDTAARLGSPEEAREKYRQAVVRADLSEAERGLLHTRIARMSAALNDMADVKAKLDLLERASLSAEAAAAYRFEKALYLLHRSMETSTSSPAAFAAESNPHEKEAEELLRRAAEDRALPEVDQWMAKGLLASSATEALQRFKEVIDREPFHSYANCYYASTAQLAGRLEEALPVVEVWLRMSPRDPSPVLYKASLLTLLGKHDEAQQAMQELKPGTSSRRVVSDATLASYELSIEVLKILQKGFVETTVVDEGPHVIWHILQALNRYKERIRPEGPADSSGIFRIPFLPAQRRAVGSFYQALKAGLGIDLTFSSVFPNFFPDPRAGLQHLEAAGSFFPEGLVLYFRSSCKLRLKDVPGAAADLEQAADLPAAFPIRRFCLVQVANYKLKLAEQMPRAYVAVLGQNQPLTLASCLATFLATPENSRAPEALRAESRNMLRQAYGLGPMNASLQDYYLDALIRSGDLVFARDAAYYWNNRKAIEKLGK